jgi:hypothetical protein
MTTLHIEHPITDVATWRAAFDAFADARRTAGVRAHRIHRPVDDDHYVLIDLDFADIAAAEAFQHFLHNVVWNQPANSPTLAGTPTTRLLQPAQS